MQKLTIYLLIALFLVFGGYTVYLNWPEQTVGGDRGTFYREVPVLDNVIATTTSRAIDIRSAKRATLLLDTTPSASGYATTTYAVTVSVDGDNYVTYNKLIDNVADTNAESLTRVASKNSSTNENLILSLDLSQDVFQYFKVSATIAWLTGTTISTSTVTAYIEY